MNDDGAAHRQRLTILVADVQSSTAAIQQLDPEDAALLLDPVLDTMIDAVKAHEGTVVSVRGDGVLAAFGAPRAGEDHALRACLAALAVLQGVRAGTPVRVGLHTGEVVLRRFGRDKGSAYDIVGVAVHIAARLEQSAAPGTACLSAATWELARQFVDAEPLPPIVAKGLDRPLACYRLLGISNTASRWHAGKSQQLSPFVGRAAELAILGRCLEEAKETTTICHVHGPAGIGKSRLAQEFVNEAGAGCYLMELPGNPHARYTVLQPLTIWLRRLLEDGDGTASALAGPPTTDAGVGRFGLDEAETFQLQTLLGLKIDGGPRPPLTDGLKPPQLARLIAKMLHAVAGSRTMIIVCDDIDNFDAPSRDVLEAIVARLDASGLLLITTSRRPTRAGTLAKYPSKSIHLSPLSEDEARRLLASVHDHIGPVPEAECLRKAGGNPLFLEEVAWLLAGGDEPPDAAPRSRDIPDRVEMLIADRLLQLPREQRELLELAAIVGLDVQLPIVAKLHDRPEAEVYLSLLKLQAASLLYETRHYPAAEFSFKHALIRDVAYHMILKAKRRRQHARLVDILESGLSRSVGDAADALCRHAIQAELWDKAVKYLQVAATAAIERAGYRQAKEYLSLALEIVRKQAETRENIEQEIDILLSLRSLVGATGKYLEAESLIEDAERLVTKIGDEKRHAAVITLKVHLLNVLGELDRALDVGKQAVAAARALGDDLLVGRAVFGLGQTYFNRGDFLDASRAFLQSVEYARRAPQALQFDLGTRSVTAHASRAMALSYRGDFAEAVEAAAAAQILAEATRRPYELAFLQVAQGMLDLHRCRPEPALASFRTGLRMAEERDLEHLFPPLMSGLGHALLLNGLLEEAAEWLMRGYEAARRHNRYMMQVWAATGLAAAQLRAGRQGAALRHSGDAVQVASQYGFRGFLVPAQRVHGRVLAASGRPGALNALRAALRLAQELGMRPDLAHCHAALASKGDEAADHADQADRLYRELGLAGNAARPA